MCLILIIFCSFWTITFSTEGINSNLFCWTAFLEKRFLVEPKMHTLTLIGLKHDSFGETEMCIYWTLMALFACHDSNAKKKNKNIYHETSSSKERLSTDTRMKELNDVSTIDVEKNDFKYSANSKFRNINFFGETTLWWKFSNLNFSFLWAKSFGLWLKSFQ